MNLTPVRRRVLGVKRRFREARMFAQAMRSPRHPILAQIVPVRRCNLVCTYCNEFDNYSKPVPTAEMLRRIDLLAGLGTTIVSISGGEPLLHPDIDDLIRRMRQHGIIASLLTNGYLLTPERIERLNRAGLDSLQISVDNVKPDDVSKKSLKVLDRKLQWLARHAEFDVNINSVVGNSLGNPEDALTIARRAIQLGLTSTVGIIHDHSGQLQPLSERHQQVYDEIAGLSKPLFSFSNQSQFQKNIAHGLPNNWHCRAGSRYLYVCEDGLVHYCSQQRGYPGIPLAEYTRAHLEREYHSVKPCAPFCTVSCVHRVAVLDGLRENPRQAIRQIFPQSGPDGSGLPAPVRLLTWVFLPQPGSGRARRLVNVTLRLLKVKEK